jgi:thioredoxin-like negative regulator of GroEL
MPRNRQVFGTMVELGLHTFPIVVGRGHVLVSWYRSQWQPWRAFAPIYQAAAARHRRVVFARVDADHERGLALRCGIESIPTLMGFCDGILVFAHVGFDIAESLDAVVRRLQRFSSILRTNIVGVSPAVPLGIAGPS